MKNFYAIFKSVFAVLVASSMLFVSCVDKYDDTALRQEIADLYEKLTKLEQKLDNEVAALKTLIDSKTVVASATKNNDGSWEILLTSGEKITVYPEYKPAAEVNNGCITVVKEGDVYYWAQIVDGTAVALVDAAGNKIPVNHNATPELRVNPTTGDVEISVDGGKTWIVVEAAEEETEESTCIFIGVDDTETSVDFYLATGEVISVPKAATIDFGIQSGKTYVAPGETVDVALKAANIEDLTIIAKPEGWKASIKGKTLTVTAPAQEKIDAAEAEAAGTIKIHASADGKCVVGKLPVVASNEKVVLEVSGDTLTIYNSVLSQYGDVNTVYYGLLPQSDFDAAAIASGMNDYSVMCMYSYDTMATVSLKEMYNQMYANIYDPSAYIDIPTGESYVVWAISEGPGTWMNPYVYTSEDVIFTVFTPSFLSVEATEVSFNDVVITANGGGHAGYVVGIIGGNSADEALMQLENSFGYWQMGWGSFGEELAELNFSGSISTFPGAYFEAVYPNTTYLVYILPLVEGKAEGDYQFSDIKTFAYTTPNIEAGGSATLSFEAVNTTYTNIEVEITGSSNTELIYSMFVEEFEIADYKTEEELLNFLIQYNTAYNTMAVGQYATAYISSLAPGASAYVCAIAVDSEGKYSKLYKQEYKTKSLNYNENLKVVIDESASKVDITTASIKISTTGGNAVSYRYFATEKSGWYWKGEEDAEGKLALNNYPTEEIAAADVIDGYIQLSELETNSEYAFAILAVDENGNASRASYYYFTPKLPEYPIVRATSESYAAMKPTYDYNVVWNGDYGRFDVSLNVTPAAGTVKYWVAVLGEDYLSSENVARDIIDYLLLKEGMYYGSKSFTGAASIVPEGSKFGVTYDVNAKIWITWVDEAGNYYESICEPIFKQTYVDESAETWAASQPTIEASLAGGVLSYTVTPGAGVKDMYILAVPNALYYSIETLTYMLTINPEAVQSSTAYSGTVEGVSYEGTVAVAWTDEAGNLYQAKTVVRP